MARFGLSQKRYARKLTHMWYGPFQVVELCGNYAFRLGNKGISYSLFPVVHVSKLERGVKFLDCPDSRW